MGNNSSFVSVIIPCRNEEKYIEECLDSVINQDYPKEKLEVLVVDGMSEDRTREVIEKYTKQYLFIKLLNNPKKITPVAFNIGVKNSNGDFIIIMGAHSVYERDYISKCVKYSNEYNADNVGGIWKIVPREKTLVAKSIAFASSSIFGAGDAYYRSGYSGKPKWVDTVFGGCYRREVFNKIGLFNENLLRSQDMEFNLRLKKAGGKILLAPDIISYYYPKSNLKDFFVHNFEDGVWITYPLKFRIKAFCWRHLMPLIFVSSLIGTIILGTFTPIFFWLFLTIIVMYLLTNIYFSMKIAAKEKDIRFLFLMPLAFATRHIGYGLGSVWGLIKLII